MATYDVKNCDNCNLILPYDPALELTKVFYQCERNREFSYMKSDVMNTYRYFQGQLAVAEGNVEASTGIF